MRTKNESIQWLHKFGYLDSKNPDSREYDTALRSMQQVYGLKQDAILGPLTNRSMGMFRCGLRDVKAVKVAGGTDCRWLKNELTYYRSSAFRFSQLSASTSVKIIDTAFQIWQQYVPLNLTRTTSRGSADILFDYGRGARYGFDGVGNVLAWAEMPCEDRDVALQTMYDADEPWSENLKVRSGVLALAVVVHEIGHLLGLDHSEDASDIMAPFYNPQIAEPQRGDIIRVQDLYGMGSQNVPHEFVVTGGVLTLAQDGASIKLELK